MTRIRCRWTWAEFLLAVRQFSVCNRVRHAAFSPCLGARRTSLASSLLYPIHPLAYINRIPPSRNAALPPPRPVGWHSTLKCTLAALVRFTIHSFSIRARSSTLNSAVLLLSISHYAGACIRPLPCHHAASCLHLWHAFLSLAPQFGSSGRCRPHSLLNACFPQLAILDAHSENYQISNLAPQGNTRHPTVVMLI